MVGIYDFVLKINSETNETFKTEGGLELYANKDFSLDKLANRIAEVLEVPKIYNGPIKKGYQIFIDISVFIREHYMNETIVENAYTIDKEKGIYKINDGLIYLYRENESVSWKGNNDNLIIKEVVETIEEKTASGIILESTSKSRKDVHEVIVGNQELKELGVKEGNKVLIDKNMKLPIYIDGKEFFQLNNRYVFAVYKN